MDIDLNIIDKMRKDAAQIFHQGLGAVEPNAAVKRYCKLDGNNLIIADRTYDLTQINNVFVVGAGKASAPMAAAIENILPHKITSGIVNVKYGHVADLNKIKLVEAGHPEPDENGRQGAQRIVNLVKSADKGDLIICLISGGGSALLPLASESLSLKDKQDTTHVLLACGATIHEINAIRKHLSRVKGGQLAKAAYPASIVSLMLSDVVGDDLDVIASGPTVPDSSTFRDCMEIFTKYNIETKLPKAVVGHIEAGIFGKVPETPKSGDPAFEKTQNLIIGSNIESIFAAKQKAETLGYHTLILSSMIEGETRDIAQAHGAMAREVLKTGNPLPKPACVLSGGETTVSIKGKGLGGRNQEFVLAAAIDIAGHNNIVVLSAGTDGNDGPTDAAGALADTHSLEKANDLNLDPHEFLSNNDSYHFFEKLGDLLKTGPTNTNVMDLRIILVA
ncbi:glycerate kinase [Thermodesulfobacteriota bacterium]